MCMAEVFLRSQFQLVLEPLYVCLFAKTNEAPASLCKNQYRKDEHLEHFLSKILGYGGKETVFFTATP